MFNLRSDKNERAKLSVEFEDFGWSLQWVSHVDSEMNIHLPSFISSGPSQHELYILCCDSYSPYRMVWLGLGRKTMSISVISNTIGLFSQCLVKNIQFSAVDCHNVTTFVRLIYQKMSWRFVENNKLVLHLTVVPPYYHAIPSPSPPSST